MDLSQKFSLKTYWDRSGLTVLVSCEILFKLGRHIEFCNADLTTVIENNFASHRQDTDRTQNRVHFWTSNGYNPALFYYYYCFIYSIGTISIAELNVSTWYIFADQVFFRSHVQRDIHLWSFTFNVL